MTSYTGTSGNDTYVTTTPPTGGDVYDGGDGTDTLIVATGTTLASGTLNTSLQSSTLTNFEILQFGAPEGTRHQINLTSAQALQFSQIIGRVGSADTPYRECRTGLGFSIAQLWLG